MSGLSKAANQKKYPHVVELGVGSGGLDVKLNWQIMQFHKSRHIEPRHGRTIVMRSGFIYRWCFEDLSSAHTLSNSLAASSAKQAFEIPTETDSCTANRGQRGKASAFGDKADMTLTSRYVHL
jgi:hypothetical protein